MVFPIVGGNQSTGDFITNSVRFDNNANYLYADRFGSATNADKYTLSFWIKRCSQSETDELFGYNYGNDSTNIGLVITLRNDDALRFNGYAPGSDHFDVKTNRLFRDPSAWYHLVFAYDSTQSTASNRQKIYVNGVEETSLATSSYTDQNFDGFLATTPNSNKGFIIGARYNSSGNIDTASYTDGYMADVYFTDGYAYAASDFGETNDNGVWVPKEADVTFGTNGYHLEFKETGPSANARGIGADTSGNDNHFSVGNITSIDVTTDTPQNNFAVANPLGSNASAFAEGNTKTTGDTGTSYSLGASSSMGFKSGKWYMEFKVSDVGNNTYIGLMKDGNHLSVNGDYQYPLGNLFYRHDGDKLSGSGSGFGVDTTYGDTFTDNDIIGVAADMDNRNLYFYKNGTIQNSGTAAFTSSLISSTAGSSIEDDTYYFFFTAGYNDSILFHNYGQPSFSISSGNTDANGYGNFEYSVPTGYYALCTKNLAEHG